MTHPKIIAFIQARMGSSRLPGKVLLDLGGKPMLQRVVERTRGATTLHQVVVATTTEPDDDPLVNFCRQNGYACSRGSLHDVLDRFYQAARQAEADVVVRVTADCPLIDPKLVDLTVNAFLGRLPVEAHWKTNDHMLGSDPLQPFAFAANRLPPPWGRTYPIGLDVEVCTFEALATAWREARQPHQREHVMPYFYDHQERFRILLVNHCEDFGALRWTVDTAEDLELVRRIIDRFPGRDDFSWLEVLDAVRREPELSRINAQVKHKDYREVDSRNRQNSAAPLLTVFSAPKPFTNPHINVIQRNAIRSWRQLGKEVEVALVGWEPGLSEAAADAGVRLLSDVQRNADGTPLISSIFALGRRVCDSPLLLFVNGDILLLPDIVDAARQVAGQVNGPFLLIGRRWDLDVTQPLDFSNGWQERLRDEVRRRGVLHRPAGSDYFIFPRQIFTDIPDFAVGRAGWDNWMIYHARKMGWPVIDGTASVLIVHQNHDYSHLPGGRPHYDLEESQVNMALAGGFASMYMVLDADKALIDNRVVRAPLTAMGLIRAVERRLTPKHGGLRGPRGYLARRFRRLRRKYYD